MCTRTVQVHVHDAQGLCCPAVEPWVGGCGRSSSVVGALLLLLCSCTTCSARDGSQLIRRRMAVSQGGCCAWCVQVVVMVRCAVGTSSVKMAVSRARCSQRDACTAVPQRVQGVS
jgi:hypothetical protein